MVTDVQLVKSGGKVQRISREEISMDTIKCSIDLYTIGPIKLVCTPLLWLGSTNQKGNVSIFEEVFGMSYERIIS